MKMSIQTNKDTTNIFGIHTQPRKTTHYTKKNEARVRWGKRKKSSDIIQNLAAIEANEILNRIPTNIQIVQANGSK